MNNKNRNRLCARLAFITASICILKLTSMNTKSDSTSTKGYQEPKGTSSSISSEYVKEESELEKSLVTSNDTNEKRFNSSISTSNSEVTSLSDGNDIDDDTKTLLNKYSSEYIAHIDFGGFKNKFYLFDVDSKTGICTEINGLFTLKADDLVGLYSVPFPVLDALTDEEKQNFLNSKNTTTDEEARENLNKIRTPQEIVEDLNKKYINKSNEEMLKQIKEDANKNEKYPIGLIKIILLDENATSYIPVLDIGDGVYYELNGDNLWYRTSNKIRYNFLDVYVGYYSKFNKSFLTAEEIYEVTNLISQDFKPERSSSSKSLIK